VQRGGGPDEKTRSWREWGVDKKSAIPGRRPAEDVAAHPGLTAGLLSFALFPGPHMCQTHRCLLKEGWL
jgi:hypothetical protein